MRKPCLLILILFYFSNFLSSQTVVPNPASPWTVPAGVTSIKVECWGGGGSGGGTPGNPGGGTSGGNGGGGGAYSKQVLTVVAGQAYTITIGNGGPASAAGNTAGSSGGTSTVTGAGGTCSAAGGGGATKGGDLTGTAGTGGGSGIGFLDSGGVGGLGGYDGISTDFSGGGGGGAGSLQGGAAGTGYPSSTGSGGAGGAGSPNAAPYVGGKGGTNSVGSAPGGGGSGGQSFTTTGVGGYAGGNGQVLITYTICTPPTITSILPASRCGTGTVILGATASAGTINWYSSISGGASIGTGTSFTTPSITGTTTYYVDATTSGCTTASRTAVTATVNLLPIAPNSVTPSSNVTVCNGASGAAIIHCSAISTGNSIYWYTVSTGGSNIGTSTSGSNLNVTPQAGTTTYYAEARTNAGCVSATRTASGPVTLRVIALSIATTNPSCGTATGIATATATGGVSPYTYQWTNGSHKATADSLLSGIYQVVVTDAQGCSNSAVASINDAGAPVITVVSVANASCNGGSNGAINISVAGGTSPYTYSWVNGATTQNISNLSAAPYEIVVKDANGCKSTKSIVVSEPSPISLTINTTNPACGSTAGGSATVVASGGTGAYTYQWSNTATTSTVSGLLAGNYSVTVKDNKGCTNSAQASVTNTGGASITLDSIKAGGCGGGKGSIYISVSGGVPAYTYSWSNGSTAKNLSGVAPGTYSLVVHDGNTCIGTFSGAIPSQQPLSQVICMVTVDTTTGTNQCIFEKDSIANLAIAHYNIYRETSAAGVYQLIGNQPAHQLSVWTDPSANPLQQAWRYKISAVDTCGIEGPISTFHKTIHLSANIGLGNVVNLIWDNYEGFAYSTYNIYRYTPATGWILLNSVAGSPTITYNSYTDLTPPTLNNLHYYIELNHPFGCTPTKAKVSGSKSNSYKMATPASIQENSLEYLINLFPNPNTGQFTVQASQIKVQRIEVYNVVGGKVFSQIVNQNSNVITIDLPNGIYFTYIQTEMGVAMKKLVIRK